MGIKAPTLFGRIGQALEPRRFDRGIEFIDGWKVIESTYDCANMRWLAYLGKQGQRRLLIKIDTLYLFDRDEYVIVFNAFNHAIQVRQDELAEYLSYQGKGYY